MNFRHRWLPAATLIGVAGVSLSPAALWASGHREAPFITTMSKVDGTNFYMFNSYEPGREGYVTLIANYLPLQDAYGGPNFFTLDKNARYEINVDNNGDAKPDVVFTFRFNLEIPRAPLEQLNQQRHDIAMPAGGQQVAATLNVLETYTVDMSRRRQPPDSAMHSTRLRNAYTGGATFIKPVDNIGNKSIPDYATYAGTHIYDVDIPHCGIGRVFAGQRKESFAVNPGEIFDLVNTNPVGPRNSEANILDDKNITSLALEVPASCLTRDKDPVIGGWTAVSKPKDSRLPSRMGGAVEHGEWVQVFRLGSPLVNDLIIGPKDKDKFNAGQPDLDSRFASDVTNPALPVLLEALFGVRAPTAFPRTDLEAIFLTGVDGLNKPKNVRAAEMLRLNTSTPVVPAAKQDSLGVLGGDVAGFPNGRRPGDDVVDIALRVVMGALLDTRVAPDGKLPYTDGVYIDAKQFGTTFPYLVTPIRGSRRVENKS